MDARNAIKITLLIFHFFLANRYPVMEDTNVLSTTVPTVMRAVFLSARQKFIRLTASVKFSKLRLFGSANGVLINSCVVFKVLITNTKKGTIKIINTTSVTINTIIFFIFALLISSQPPFL